MGEVGAGGTRGRISQTKIEQLLVLRQAAEEARTGADKKKAGLAAEEKRRKPVGARYCISQNPQPTPGG